MRKVVASEFVPLDSVLEDPSWTFQFSTEDWSWGSSLRRRRFFGWLLTCWSAVLGSEGGAGSP